jgi:hypothetical protein
MKNNFFSKIAPIITIFLISPILAEFLMGSTPASRSNQLILESLYYGSGAILIRELARRFQLGWLSIIILGVAYGITEECLTLQTVFNTAILGNNFTYGRWIGVNWVWAMCIILYHALWSITIPIFLAELLFPGKKEKGWLTKTGIVITSGLFLLTSVAFFYFYYKMTSFIAPFSHFLVAAVLMIFFVTLSFYISVNVTNREWFKRSRPVVAGMISFVGSILWFVMLTIAFRPNLGINPLIVLGSGVFIVFLTILLIFNWNQSNWGVKHRFFLACGSIYASMLFGFVTLYQINNKLDYVVQLCAIVIVSILLTWLYKQQVASN